MTSMTPAEPVANRKIIHVDMDCFYAAIEERDNPQLRGKPLAVGGSSRDRGVLTTCNYAAREFGCHSAMPTFQAVQRCPHLVVVPPRFPAYKAESARVREIFRQFTQVIEPLSLDEAYLDVSSRAEPVGEIATEIRQRIHHTTGLTASAGMAPNKMLAKIASDWRKPNGQFEVRQAEIAAFMRDLPARKIWGVGPKAAEKLNRHNINTCGELQKVELPELQRMFGKFGIELYELSRGIDRREVKVNRERKSISNENTFRYNLRTLAQCQKHMNPLFEELAADISERFQQRRLHKAFVKLKFTDFSITTAERPATEPDWTVFTELLEEAFGRKDLPVRLIGVGMRFAPEEDPAARQLELFGE
jgi:DNA polymerase-4